MDLLDGEKALKPSEIQKVMQMSASKIQVNKSEKVANQDLIKVQSCEKGESEAKQGMSAAEQKSFAQKKMLYDNDENPD